MAEFRLTPPRDAGAMGSLYGADLGPVPYSPPMGFEDMSPAERAAYRVRGGPPAAAPYVQSPAELAQSVMQTAPMFMGPVGAAIQDPEAAARMTPMAAPATGAVRAATGQTPPSVADLLAAGPAGAGETKDEVKARQQKLKAGGFYNGPIDGSDGDMTKAAQAKFDAAERAQDEARSARELETLKAGNASKQAEADAQRAANERAGLELADKQRIAKEQGNQRLKDIESDVPIMSQIVRDYATPAGLLLGSGIGTGLRYGVVKGSNALSQRAANKAEELFDRGASGIPNRTARVNEFWRQGGAGAGEVPYLTTPAQAPGKAVNEGARAAENLFQPPAWRQGITDVGLPGAMMGESLYSQTQLAPAAAERLQRALAAVNAEPSEANIKEYQAAKDNDAAIRFITNLGRGGAAGYGSGALKWQRNPSKPSMEAAEAERSKVDAMIRAAVAREQAYSAPAVAAPLQLQAPPAPLALPAPPASSVAERLARMPTASGPRMWPAGAFPPPER